MKNYEKYADEIREYKGTHFCRDFIEQHILKSDDCYNVGCARCKMLQMIWLMEEYEEPKEPEIDWSKVEVDTPILVKFVEDEEWEERHFAKYENGKVYAWSDGCTSWSTRGHMVAWKYAKLAEDKKEYEESEVDWSKVEVDTPILVRDRKHNKWVRRCFAKYEDGIIYAWQAGCTSQSIAVHMIKWNYAKLIENEETK